MELRVVRDCQLRKWCRWLQLRQELVMNCPKFFFGPILKNIEVFYDVGWMRHDISEVFLALTIQALCTVCKYYQLRRRSISQKTSLHRILYQIREMEINTEKNYLTLWNVVLKSYVYVCFNFWSGSVLTTQHVRVFMLLWQGTVSLSLSLSKLSQILIIIPVQCLSCETRYDF